MDTEPLAIAAPCNADHGAPCASPKLFARLDPLVNAQRSCSSSSSILSTSAEFWFWHTSRGPARTRREASTCTEGLTRDGIPSPSAHDPARNRHRCGIAWNKFAVRAILINPRYTGHQVWNKQRKDEVLIDVEDVALGHMTKLRWNDSGTWLWSKKIVQPPIIDKPTFRPRAAHDQRACHRARPAQAAPRPAPVRAARLRLVRICAPGGCRATGSETSLTTGAGSPPSTRSPTGSSTH